MVLKNLRSFLSISSHRRTSFTNFLWKAFTSGFNYKDNNIKSFIFSLLFTKTYTVTLVQRGCNYMTLYFNIYTANTNKYQTYQTKTALFIHTVIHSTIFLYPIPTMTCIMHCFNSHLRLWTAPAPVPLALTHRRKQPQTAGTADRVSSPHS